MMFDFIKIDRSILPKFSSHKSIYWIKILSKFISIQLVVQILGFASGILLIRLLDKQEYAYLALANSMQGTMNVLANSGIGSALSSIGGKVWQDSYRFGQLINTALEVKRHSAIIIISVVMPLTIWIFLKNGISLNYAILLLVGILIELHFYFSNSILNVVPRLRSQFKQLQNFDLIFAVTRLVLVLGSSIIFMNAAVAVFASTVASGIQNIFLKSLVNKTIQLNIPTNQEDKREILKLIKFQAPTTIFYCFQGQLTIWLISLFGSTENIAEIGALSRINVVFSVVNLVFLNIAYPSLARLNNTNIFIKKYIILLFVSIFVSGIFLLTINTYPQLYLYFLGEKYSYLTKELYWISLLSILQFIASVLWSINLTKGWMKQAWLLVPLTIITQILLLLCLDLSTVKGVIVFNIFSIFPLFIINFLMTFYGIKTWKLQIN